MKLVSDNYEIELPKGFIKVLGMYNDIAGEDSLDWDEVYSPKYPFMDQSLKLAFIFYKKDAMGIENNEVLPLPDPNSPEFNKLMNYMNFLRYESFVRYLIEVKTNGLKGLSEADQKKSLGLPPDFDWKVMFASLGMHDYSQDVVEIPGF